MQLARLAALFRSVSTSGWSLGIDLKRLIDSLGIKQIKETIKIESSASELVFF